MKNNLFTVLFLSFSLNFSLSYAQVGIGTTTPQAFLNVPRGRTVLFGEDSNYVNNSAKFIWYGSKGALRAGYIDNTSWNSANIGDYSLATGYSNLANGYAATAIGQFNTASGRASLSMGYASNASGNFAAAMGSNATASGYSSMVLGQSATASGYTSRAIGYVATASGDFSTAMGNYVSTNTKKGSFIIGDISSGPPPAPSTNPFYINNADNQMMMRFAGGYVLYSSAPQSQTDAVGVQLSPNDNAWTIISDSTRKENFKAVNGASFLKKIAAIRLGSWNYKGQDVRLYRHYGPMAQDFFTAFGHDELGTIGEEKRINQADFDGVNMIAIQALIKEVEQLKAELANSRQREMATQSRLDKIEAVLLDSGKATATIKP
ncbi:tail fiber domain-containing protein [Spirosoma koreense]